MKPLDIGKGRGLEQESPEAPLVLTAEDLGTHVHGIGGTRSGKSKMIEHLARQLLSRRHGFCLIDPHGTLYQALVDWLYYLGTPRDDVIFLNPSSDARIVGFNPFVRGDAELSVQVDRLIRATIKAWGATSTDETPRLERWLRCVFHTMLEGGFTLPILGKLLSFSAKQERAYLTSRVTWDLIRNEWDELASHARAKDFSDQIESTKNRLFRFLYSTQINRVMGLPDNNVDVGQVIADGKALIVNLQPSRVLSAEQAELFGTLLLDEVWHVTSQRRERTLTPFFLIVDEFQKYLTPDVPEMLDQAAKRGLHLMLFHQHLDQLRRRDEEAYSSVMTNARTKLVFGALSREDAHTMVEQIFPGQIDLKMVKNTIVQTKFWPRYGRDEVRSRASSTSKGASLGLRDAWDPDSNTWITALGETDVHGGAEAVGVSDIPIFTPEPFQEVSNMEFYSLDELKWMLSDQLMSQFQRHYMARRPGQDTVAAVAPWVRSWAVDPDRVATFIDRSMASFLTAGEVDRRIQAMQAELQSQAAAVEPRIIGSSSSSKRSRR